MDRQNIMLLATRPIIVKSEGLSRHTLFSMAAALAVVGYLALTFENIEAQREAADVKYIASLIELNSEISSASLHTFVGKAYAVVDRNECRSDVLYAGSSVILANLDRIAATGDRDKLTESLRSADTFFSHSLSCAPTNGDAWARLAMVRLASGASETEVAAMLKRSKKFAPADGATLAARLSVWTIVPEATLRLAEEALDSDLGIAFARFSTSDLAQAFSRSSVALQKKLIVIANTLPADRVQRLRSAGLNFLPAPSAIAPARPSP